MLSKKLFSKFIIVAVTYPISQNAFALEWGVRKGLKLVSNVLPAPGGELYLKPHEQFELNAGAYWLFAYGGVSGGVRYFFDADAHSKPYISLQRGYNFHIMGAEDYYTAAFGLRRKALMVDIGPSWTFNRGSSLDSALGVAASIHYTFYDSK